MFDLDQFVKIEVLYFLIAAFAVSFFRKYRVVLFLEFLLNLYFVFFLFFKSTAMQFYPLIFLLVISVIIYALSGKPQLKFIAYFLPVLVLILSRVLPGVEMADLSLYFGGLAPALFAKTGLLSTIPILGLSYLVFRWYRFLLDVKTDNASFSTFLLYCFYVPIFYIGPITSYTEFSLSVQKAYTRTVKVFIIAFLRILWGAFKFYPLASLFYQLTFSRILLNQNAELNIRQVLLAVLSYPAYLFLNFSGFIDIVIGLSAIFGFHIDKNFDRPYLATSVREFWRRWHISLTELLKDLIHIPTIKFLENRGVTHLFVKYTVAVSLVFLVMAYWHGNTLNFYIFSSMQILALIVERRLRQNSKIQESVKIMWMKRMALWMFLAISFFFFENNIEQIHQIMQKLH